MSIALTGGLAGRPGPPGSAGGVQTIDSQAPVAGNVNLSHRYVAFPPNGTSAGDVPTVQEDGTIAYAAPTGGGGGATVTKTEVIDTGATPYDLGGLTFLTGALSDSPDYIADLDPGSGFTIGGVAVETLDAWATFLDTANSNAGAKLAPGVWEIHALFSTTDSTLTRAIVSSGTADIVGGVFSSANDNSNKSGVLHFYVEVTADATIAFQGYMPTSYAQGGSGFLILDPAAEYPAGWDSTDPDTGDFNGTAPAIPAGFTGWTATKIK